MRKPATSSGVEALARLFAGVAVGPMCVRKSAAIGITSDLAGLRVPGPKAFFQTRHFLRCFLIQPSELLRQGYVTVLVGQFPGVQNLKDLLGEVEEPNDVAVLNQGLSNVVNLPPGVFSAWVRQEGDGFEMGGAGCDVNKFASGVLPDRVKLGFNEYAGALPDGPSKDRFAAKRRRVLSNNGEAFVVGLIWAWLAEHGFRLLIGGDGQAKRFDVRGADLGGYVHGETASDVVGLNGSNATVLTWSEDIQAAIRVRDEVAVFLTGLPTTQQEPTHA